MHGSSRWTRSALTVGLVVAIGIIAGLVIQKRSAVADYHRALWERTVPRAGVYLPEVTLPSITGDSLHVAGGKAGQRQVLLYFTTECPYCRASLSSWNRLAQDLEGRAGVIGISLSAEDSTAAYSASNRLSFPIIVVPKDASRLHALLRTAIVPATVVVDTDGRVLFARLGVVESPIVADSIREAALYQPQGDRL